MRLFCASLFVGVLIIGMAIFGCDSRPTSKQVETPEKVEGISMLGWWLSEDATEQLLVFDRVEGVPGEAYYTAIVSLCPDCSSVLEGDVPVERTLDEIKTWMRDHNGHEITGCKGGGKK